MFKDYFKSKSKRYLVITMVLSLVLPMLAFSYSSFIYSSDDYRASEMYIGSLLYGIKINGESTSEISVPSGSTEYVMEITSLNIVSSFYKLIYETNENIEVKYNPEDYDMPSGDISNVRTIKLQVKNKSKENIKVKFDIAAGYITNNLSDVKIKEGYTEVKDFYEIVLGDIKIALKVDGEEVSNLSNDKYYILDSYECENNSTIEYNRTAKKIITTTSNVPEICNLEFIESTLINVIEKDNKIYNDNENSEFVNNTTPGINFSAISSDTNGKGLYRTSDLTKTEDTNNDGKGEEVLYFRGAVTNNYLVFADFCWRIVRTNEDGSIKLRYGGTPTISGDTYTCPQTGTNVRINNANYSYNTAYNNAKYVGYTYDTSTTDTTQKDSLAKSTIDTWYEKNIANKDASLTSLIVDTPYCNDRSITSTSGSYIRYAPAERLGENITDKKPQYKCPQKSDKYTKSTTIGNGLLKYPIALLTMDEIAYAGGVNMVHNKTYYLYTNSNYWSMSPYHYWISTGDIVASRMYNINTTNGISAGNVKRDNNETGLIPALSLISTAKVSQGTGLYNDPYVISTN